MAPHVPLWGPVATKVQVWRAGPRSHQKDRREPGKTKQYLVMAQMGWLQVLSDSQEECVVCILIKLCDGQQVSYTRGSNSNSNVCTSEGRLLFQVHPVLGQYLSWSQGVVVVQEELDLDFSAHWRPVLGFGFCNGRWPWTCSWLVNLFFVFWAVFAGSQLTDPFRSCRADRFSAVSQHQAVGRRGTQLAILVIMRRKTQQRGQTQDNWWRMAKCHEFCTVINIH